MKKAAVALLILGSLGCLPLHAGEMFEDYPKHFALGWVDDLANARYWFNPAWALDMTATVDDLNATQKYDDGVVIARDEADTSSYTLGFAAVRSLKSFHYFDLNLKGGFLYSSGKGKSDPEGPNNKSTTDLSGRSLFVGPEVEIKIPHLSRLVIVSSLQLTYSVHKASTKTETIGGVVSVKNEQKSFGLESDENSLDEFMHLGIRYYF